MFCLLKLISFEIAWPYWLTISFPALAVPEATLTKPRPICSTVCDNELRTLIIEFWTSSMC